MIRLFRKLYLLFLNLMFLFITILISSPRLIPLILSYLPTIIAFSVATLAIGGSFRAYQIINCDETSEKNSPPLFGELETGVLQQKIKLPGTAEKTSAEEVRELSGQSADPDENCRRHTFFADNGALKVTDDPINNASSPTQPSGAKPV